MILTFMGFLAGGMVTLPPEVVLVEGVPPERVQISVSVTNRAGEPVLDLSRADFLVLEDGRPQALLDFGQESQRMDRPLSIVFLVDRSGSIGKQMGKWRQACGALASALRSIDEVRLATFTSEVVVLQEFTSDPARLASAVEGLGEPGGGTDIFGSLDRSLRDLRDRRGRKAIFLLTDGLDTLRSSSWSLSGDEYLTGLLRRAVAFQTTIVTILPGPSGFPYLAVQDLAVRSGGGWYYPTDDLPGLARRLGERLLHSYYLAYDSPRAPDDQRRRRLEVRVTRAGSADLEVRTVDGVFGTTPLLDALAADLRDGDESERVRAAAGLGALADPRSVRWLLRALKEDSPRVRQAASDALRALAASSTDPTRQQKILEAIEDLP